MTTPPNKTKLSARKRKFDLKFLLTGNSGSGKTHFTASYDLGPIHYYMFDKGGEKTIEKIMGNRNDITIDNFSPNSIMFSDFWKQFQEDEKAGLFDWLAENKGLLVIDSLTNANQKAIKEIEKKSNVTPSGIGKAIDMKKGMAPAHWGQLLQWMTTLTSSCQELPCAVAITVHLHVLMNKDQEVVARYPMVNGQFRQILAADFDEAYLLTSKGNKRQIYFTEKLSFEAKSRVFDMDKIENITMTELVQAYLDGKTSINKGKI
ncbi:MAG: AAA family ATPase [Thermotogota bacterium]|nr:AAA family ATPase [Thermotogota bacterium]